MNDYDMVDPIDDPFGLSPFTDTSKLSQKVLHDTLRETVADLVAVRNEITGNSRSILQSVINDCRNCGGDCIDCLRGSIQIRCGESGQCAAEVVGKLYKSLQGHMAGAAGLAVALMTELGIGQSDVSFDQPIPIPQPISTVTVNGTIDPIELGKDWRQAVNQLQYNNSSYSSTGHSTTTGGGTVECYSPCPSLTQGNCPPGEVLAYNQCSDNVKVVSGCTVPGSKEVHCPGSGDDTHGDGKGNDTGKGGGGKGDVPCSAGNSHAANACKIQDPTGVNCTCVCINTKEGKTRCELAHGNWIENDGGNGGKCIFDDGSSYTCVDKATVDNPPFKLCTEGEGKAWIDAQPSTTEWRWVASGQPHFPALYNSKTFHYYPLDGTGDGCVSGTPGTTWCEKPAEASDNAKLVTKSDGSGQWVEPDGTLVGDICPPPNCPKPDDATSGAVLLDWGDGTQQWVDLETGEAFGSPCPCKPAETKKTDQPHIPRPPDKVTQEVDCDIVCSPCGYKSYTEIKAVSCNEFSAFFSFFSLGTLNTNQGWFNTLVNAVFGPTSIVGLVTNAAANAPKFIDGFSQQICTFMNDVSVRSVGKTIQDIEFSGLFGWADRLWPLPPMYKEYLTRVWNTHFQAITPSSDELDLMRLRECIDETEWKHGQRLNGVCLPWAEKSYKASTEYLPGPQDLVRFMTRDVFDDQVVTDNKLDDEFTIKFSGKAQQWAKKQGMTDEQFKYYWRAHWQIVSNTQMYEFEHRLRPDADVKDSQGQPLVWTRQDTIKWLKINDIAPGMVEQLAAVSFLPMGRIDIRRAYSIGVLEENDLKGKFLDLGYDAKTAETLQKYTVRVEGPNRAKLQGQLPLAEATRLFMSDQISDDDYQTLLQQAGIPEDVIQNYVQSSRIKRNAADRKVILAKLRSAYLSGRMDDNQYRGELGGVVGDENRVGDIVNRDQRIRDLSYKQIAIAKACKLVGQGYMDVGAYLQLSRNLGYSQQDATMLVGSCVSEIQDQRMKKLEADIRKAQADAEKADKRRVAELKRQAAIAKKQFPCKDAAKPDCPPGVTTPDPIYVR